MKMVLSKCEGVLKFASWSFLRYYSTKSSGCAGEMLFANKRTHHCHILSLKQNWKTHSYFLLNEPQSIEKNTKCVSVYWSDVIQPVKVMNLTILYKNYESKISNIGTRTQTTMQKANNKKNVRFYVLKCVSQIIRKYFKKYLTRQPARYSFF